ncbi:hypothetical protein JHK85_020244 [Glycine max]|uniref:Uncharacterized protein n=1 Tax=Glycine max TaxID=3847 RepID=I1KN28_SOYBN|nr:hypothetical protein JHK87_019677 [Glycine soja]KAG5023902.1 hypothetical protein JHK85_020244 [Glycine max]KAG5038974.1 hypothetical protein JHK86_019814 [Glycine max]
MQVFSNARQASRLLLSPHLRSSEAPHSTALSLFSGLTQRDSRPVNTDPIQCFLSKAFYSSGVGTVEATPSEDVKELYDKMLDSVKVKRSMPPNAWLWSMIANCKHQPDIRLLFDILQNLRRFVSFYSFSFCCKLLLLLLFMVMIFNLFCKQRLSNLRIHDNFNCNLCREVAKACVHAGALDFGMKALWKHNVYGLTPNIASAHHLLTNAKNHNDTKLLVEVMKLLKKNDLPLQPGTADIVFSICYNTDDWELINKYAKRFVMAGVKLRQTSLETWMEFAAKRGDIHSLWKIEKLRSNSMKQHTLITGFSCVKGLLLERKPSDAVAVIQVLNQTLSDTKKSGIKGELQKLVSEWPLEVIKHQKEEDRKALAASLKSDILVMVSELLSMGLEANVSLEDLDRKEDIPQ